MSMCARPSRRAINRDELTSTVLKDTAVPAKSILAPSYPGFQQKIADEAKFDPEAAKAELAKAGYPDGKGFPPIEIWYREQGGYNARHRGADAAVPAGAVQDDPRHRHGHQVHAVQGLDGGAQGPEQQPVPRALRVRLPRSVELLRPVQDRRPSPLRLSRTTTRR